MDAGKTPRPGTPDAQQGRDCVRTVPAGGEVTQKILHEATAPFEQFYRKYPAQGMFRPDLTQDNPFSFEMGAYRVPESQWLFIFDIRADVYRPSGVAAGDTVPVVPRALSNFLGFSLTVNGKTQGNLDFNLEPSPVNLTGSLAYPGGTGVNQIIQTPYGPQVVPTQLSNLAQFQQAAAGRFATASGQGTALQPQRPDRYGARNLPFTLYAKSNETVSVKCVVWRPLPVPVAFFEYSVSGLLIPSNVAYEIMNSAKYPQSNSESIR